METTPLTLRFKLIGLGYQARAGKDTVAGMLAEHGYKRVSFGDQVRKVASVMCNEDAFGPRFKEEFTSFGLYGGELLQKIGEGMRQIVSPHVWVYMSGLHYRVSCGDLIVVSDVRYQAEASYIKALGGLLVNVRRPGLRYDSHVSETEGADIPWDYTIINDGTIADLAGKVAQLVAHPPQTVPGA